jgi:hypothetical protein
MKKLILVLVLVFALAIPALANPFVDVPLNHWAYDAVQTLAAKGVIVGYPDGTFGGQRTLTRYEMAEALAKALAYVEQYGGIKEDVEILSKLAVEFADELANLGVKVADLEATLGEQSEAVAAMQELVDKHERFFEPVTISGEFGADYSYTVIGDAATPAGTAELSDYADITLTAEINPETTASITLEVDNVLSGAPTVTFDDYDLKYTGDWSLWVGSGVKPATIGLGLIYDSNKFPGAWAQWEWDTDEDLGTWTMFMDVDDFYVLNVALALGDDDDIPVGITASYDQAAGNALVFGADVSFDLTDSDDEDQIGMALEAGAMTDFATTTFGAAANLSAVFGEDDEIAADIDVWYLQDGFAPTNSDFDSNELGVEVAVDLTLTDEDDDMQIAAGPYWGYTMDALMTAPTDHYVGLQLDLTEFDEDHPDTSGMASVEYSLFNGDITLEANILDLYLDDDEDLALNVVGNYVIGTPSNYSAVANIIYGFEDDMELIVEGRLDSDGAALYSAEAQLVYAVAENTELKFGVEMNDWKRDINKQKVSEILDTTTKIYGGVEVSF